MSSGETPSTKEWTEAARRLRIIRSYLDIEDPSQKDKARAIEDLGLSDHSFMRLARILRRHSAPKNQHSKRTSRVHPLIDLAIDEAIEAGGPDASILSIAKRVEEAVKAIGMTPPAYKTIERRARASLARGDAEDTTLILDAVLLDAPTTVDGERTVPLAVLAINPSPPTLVGLRITATDPTTEDMGSVLRQAVRTMERLPSLIVGRFPETDPAWTALVTTLARADLAVEREAPRARSRRSAYQLLGSRIAGMPTKPRLSRQAILSRNFDDASTIDDIDLFMRTNARLGSDLSGDRGPLEADLASPRTHRVANPPETHGTANDAARVLVAQSDRERAVEIREAKRQLSPPVRAAILRGARDNDPLILGLAKHRVAAETH